RQAKARKTQAAQAELAQISARTSANLAAVVLARRKLRLWLFALARLLKLLFDLCVFNSFSCSHAILKKKFCLRTCLKPLLRAERHAQMPQQRSRLIVVAGCGHDSYVHAFLLIDLGVIDLGKNQLVVQAQRVITAAIERLGRDSLEVAHT